MPKIVFTESEIENYVKEKPLQAWCFYDRATKSAHAMAVHANGEYPEDLIKERRPHELPEVQEYREKIWKPITKATWTKVFSELQKIRKSSDWSVRYELDDFTLIREDENLETYCEQKYPHFRSITNWAFSALLRKLLIDPNAVCIVRPIVEEVKDTGFLRPVAQLYSSKHIIDYVPEDFVVLNDPAGCIYAGKDGEPKKGRRIIIVTTVEFLAYNQINDKEDFALVEEWAHELPVLPAFSLTGVLVDTQWPHLLYESRLAGMLPYLDEAVREYSDLQAATVLNMFPERWEYVQTECPSCRGSGVIPNPKWFDGCPPNIAPTCRCEYTGCSGGYIASGPYSKILVRASNNAVDGAQVPSPPAGFIEKDVEIIRLQKESVRQNQYDALGSVNFEFLAETPLNQSGTAKEVDADALNNTVHSIAEDVVYALDQVYLLIALYRYKSLYKLEDIQEMVPSIPVPERFDILSSSRTMEEIGKASTNKTNPVIKSALEIDFASKRFSNDPEVRDMVALTLRLDPLPNITEDDKMSRLSNKGITQLSYVISSNIEDFVRRALNEDEDFATQPIDKQKQTIEAYAQEVIDANDEAAKIAMENAQAMMGEQPVDQPEDEGNIDPNEPEEPMFE